MLNTMFFLINGIHNTFVLDDSIPYVKGPVHLKMKLSYNVLALMLMESQEKSIRPPNIAGASQQNSVAAFSYTTEVAGDLF